MPEGLKIQVGADVQQAVKALASDIPKAADITANSVQKIGKGFQYAGLESQHMAQKLKSSFQSVSNAAKASSRSINIFEGSIEDLEARIGARKSLIRTETDVNNISKLNKEISLLELRVSDLSNTGRVKFNQFGAAITNTAQSAKIANAQINITGLSLSNVGGAAQKAFAGLLRISYLLPGLGFAGLIGIIGGVAGALLGIGTSAKQTAVDFGPLAAKLKETVDREKEFKDAIDKASASVVGQASGLSDLRNILINVNSEFRGLTQNIIDQALTQVLFDKKNVEVQRLLTAEVQKRFKLLKQQNPFSDTKTFTDKTFSTDPLEREIDDASQSIDLINNKARLLGLTFDNVFNRSIKLDKVKPGEIEKELKAAIGSIRLQLPTIFDIESGDAQSRFSRQLKELESKIRKTGTPVVLPVRINIPNDEFDKLRKQQEIIAQIFGISTEESPLSQIQKEAVFAAQAINEILQPAFKGLFDAILAGENPLKAFFTSLGNAVAQLVQKLISAAITAAILSAIFPAGVGGSKGFGSIFGKILGFAAGGLVTGPQLALIGEGSGTSKANPEVVAPLDKLKGMLTGLGGGSQVVVMRTIVRGNNLALVQARTSRSQKRTTGR